MGCKDCPPTPDVWCVCNQCDAKYKDYDGMFHSLFCPRCAERVLQARALATARHGATAAGFLTNEPEAPHDQ